MAQFYAEIQGNRGPASRMGSKDSGITSHVRGWDVGVRVAIHHVDGTDYVSVFRTGGSNGHSSDKLIAQFSDHDTGGSAMEQITATYKQEKDTKNKVRFEEVVEDGATPVTGTLYVDKEVLSEAGFDGENLVVTISA